MNIAIIGSGKIGIDLYVKCSKASFINNCKIFNRNEKSLGSVYCKSKKYNLSSKGVNQLISEINYFDIIVDATSAKSNIENYKKLKSYLKGKFFINLTPSGIGNSFVPFKNIESIPNIINMISCGGQSTIPIISELNELLDKKLNYVELVSSISSVSAGPATRENINEYINATSKAIKKFTKIKTVKVIINLNPSNPPVNMMNTIFFEKKNNFTNGQFSKIKKKIAEVNKIIKQYIPQYNAKFFSTFEKNIFRVTIRVVGQGDYLPPHAGNLDIINSSSLHIMKLINEKK